jgi:hypothetical protein
MDAQTYCTFSTGKLSDFKSTEFFMCSEHLWFFLNGSYLEPYIHAYQMSTVLVQRKQNNGLEYILN